MNTRSFCIKLVLAVSVAFAAPCLRAQDGIGGALRRANLGSALGLTAPFGRTLAAADFDNDHKLDGAVLVDSGRFHGQTAFRIELHLSGSLNRELTFESAEASLAITALDVNQDGATDVVVVQALTHQRLFVWLNDGHGVFRRGRIEDFPSDDDTTACRFDSLSPSPDSPAICFSPQRGTEAAKLTAQFLASRPAAASKFYTPSVISSIGSRALSPNPSRAPPRIS